MKTKTMFRQWVLGLLSVFALSGAGVAQAQSTYVKVTSEEELVSGGKYLIVCEKNKKALSHQNGKFRDGVDITINETGNTITVKTAETMEDKAPCDIVVEQSESYWTLFDPVSSQYLVLNNADNALHSASTKSDWQISISPDGEAFLTPNAYPDRKLKWNASSPRFACYTSAQTAIQLYKKQESSTCGQAGNIQAVPAAQSVSLSWTVAIPAPESYAIAITGEGFEKKDTVTGSEYTCDGLTAETEYAYSITAICSEELSGDPVTGTFRTLAPTDPVLTVTVPKADSLFTGAVSFAWETTNFELGTDGLVSIVLNENPALYSAGEDTTLTLPTGQYEAVFSLVGMDKTPLEPAVSVSRSFSVDFPDVETPEFSLNPAVIYEHDTVLRISCQTEGASIFYALDNGSEFLPYAEAIPLVKTTEIKAFATKAGMDTSAIATAKYILIIKPEIEGELVFSENFDRLSAGTMGTPGSAIDEDIANFLPGWSGANVYPAGKTVKLGTGSKAGSLTLPDQNLSFNEGKFFVAFTAQAWRNDATEINLVVNEEIVTVAGLDNSGIYGDSNMREYVYAFENGTASTSIGFKASKASNGRFFLDSIRIYQVLPEIPMLSVNPKVEISTIQTMAASQEVTVKGKLLEADVRIECPEGNFSVSPASLKKDSVMRAAGAAFVLTYNGELLSDSAKIIVSSGDLKDTVNVYATAVELHEAADLAALRNGTENAYYKVSGEVVLTAQDSYRNSKWLEDSTGGILIDDANGLVSTSYEIGDGITGIIGKLGSFGGQLQLVMTGNLPEASSEGNTVEPLAVTCQELNEKIGELCSRLVKLENLRLIEAEGEWESNKDHWAVSGTDTINIRTFVRNGDFIGTAKPAGRFNLVALAGVYNGAVQISPRTKADITEEVLPDECEAPTDLTVSGGDCSYVTVSWEGQTAQFKLALLSADSKDTLFTTILSEKQYTFESDKIELNTEYGWAVASLCESGDLRWARGENFRMTVANEKEQMVSFRIYPNPSKGNSFIESEENTRMEIFTLTGICVQTAELPAGIHEIKLNQSGTYFVRLSSKNASTVKRLIVR